MEVTTFQIIQIKVWLTYFVCYICGRVREMKLISWSTFNCSTRNYRKDNNNNDEPVVYGNGGCQWDNKHNFRIGYHLCIDFTGFFYIESNCSLATKLLYLQNHTGQIHSIEVLFIYCNCCKKCPLWGVLERNPSVGKHHSSTRMCTARFGLCKAYI